jgi:hypothetical protein
MDNTDQLPITVPEVRRLLLTLAEPDERFSIRLAWSVFRRRHQAIAKRCHAIRRSLRVGTAKAITRDTDTEPISRSPPPVPQVPQVPSVPP